MSRADRGPGAFRAGAGVSFDAGRRGSRVGVLVEFRGSRWVVRTSDAHTWRVPASMLTPVESAATRPGLLDAGRAALAEQDAARQARVEETAERLAPLAARWKRGDVVEVVHRNHWGWTATVVEVDVAAGKVTVTNPTRGLLDRMALLGVDVPNRRTSRTVTLWANRVREPRELPRGGAW